MAKVIYITLFILMLSSLEAYGQNSCEVSLYLKKDKATQLDSISSKNGNLFNKLGHHGPAVENPWLAFRFYFDKRTALDLYSKASPGPELLEKHWYPSRKDQEEGWGGDYYKVGKSVGLGGIRLWDGNNLVPLHPVSQRLAKVFYGVDSSYMEMLSEGVSYGDQKVDILMRLTVYPELRHAKVEAFSMKGEKVRFATGINYFEDLKIREREEYIATWGLHPEDVAAEPSEVGAAILFQKELFDQKVDDGKQFLLITRPCIAMHTWITSANAREGELNTFEKFIQHIEKIEITKQ